MHLIYAPLASFAAVLPEVAVRADRQQLARRRWRAAADDGMEFGFELEAALRHGDVVWAGAQARYVIRQSAEPVLEIPLDMASDAAAVIGWAVGNLHSAIEAQPTRILAPDDPGLRQTLDRLGIPYQGITAVFQPHRFAGNLAGHGHAHHHDHPHPAPHDHGHAPHH
ncbi:MAG: urease accessory protein UreE [Opitutaceae bacterium]|nr:urease accessory protein UreE [Opitutaceae bacterium]